MGPLKRLIIKTVIKTPECLINYVTDTSSIIRDGDIKKLTYDGIIVNERFGLITDSGAVMRFYAEQEIDGQPYKQQIDIYIEPSDFHNKIAPYIRTVDRYVEYQKEYRRLMNN